MRGPAGCWAAPAAAMRRNRGERRLLLLIFLECLVCLFIWWRGVVIALGNQPQHRSWDMLRRQRRADRARNELEQRIVLVVVVGLTEHFGRGIKPIRV